MGKYEVLIAENRTGITVRFRYWRLLFRWMDKRLLLFLTDDMPFEEMLNIALIDLDDGVKEILTLGGAYLTGSFTDLHIASNALSLALSVRQHGGLKSSVTFVKVPFTGDPRGVSRSVAVKHYIKITANPPPARIDGSR